MSEEKKKSSMFDKVSGSVKETVGKVTDNEKLKAEGATQKAKGKAKEVIEDASNAAKGFVDGLSEKK
ncbi:CsbD family protein [Ignavigranum ruoffiae]|uniref:CsbD-like n=1 Tax=Ignavigranum ruoffiae TaxID=89093 RepID=A0A1H9CJQ3_9LACT|nr:CsbD family protein [Ignavigranum ruoffiae]UPQ86619.1 CsbD family protein [Ignavigranum ruoffiae]SEQ01389.1 CsbD-like [Ignavigranum ruoffiae]